MVLFKQKIVARLSALVLLGTGVILTAQHILAEQPATKEPARGGEQATKGESSLQYLLQEPTRLKQDSPLRCLAFSPDGKILAAGGSSGYQLWDMKTGKEIRRVGGENNPIANFGFAPDGNLWTTSDKAPNQLKLWDVSTGKLLHTLDHCSTFFAFTPDGKYLVTSGPLSLREVATGKVKDTFQESYREPERGVTTHYNGPILIAPNGKTLITVRKTVTTKRILLRKPTAPPIEDQLTEVSGAVHIWDMNSKKMTWSLAINAEIDSLCYSGDGSLLLAQYHYFSKDAERMAPLEKKTPCPSVAFCFWSKEHQEVLHSFPSGSACSALSFDGKALVVGNGKKVCVLDIPKDRLVLETKDQAAAIIAVALSPDGKTLVAASADGTILKWQAAK